jgi:putative transcriptional regulator
LPDSNFYRTVVLIIHHDEQGAFGVVLNRPADNTIAEIWEAVGEEPCYSAQQVNVGGPVSGPLMALHTNQSWSESEILPGIHFAAHKDHLNEIVKNSEERFRIFSGYSGWAPGQLESELKYGGWMVLPASEDYIFGNPEDMWRKASQEIGRGITDPLVNRGRSPDDPSWN